MSGNLLIFLAFLTFLGGIEIEHCAKLDQVHLVITFFQIKRQYVEYFYPHTEFRCLFRTPAKHL